MHFASDSLTLLDVSKKILFCNAVSSYLIISFLIIFNYIYSMMCGNYNNYIYYTYYIVIFYISV